MASPNEDDASEERLDQCRIQLIDSQVFERLKNKTDVNEQKRLQDELNSRLYAQHQRSQERLAELVGGPEYQESSLGHY